MKFQHLLSVVALGAITLFSACANDSGASSDESTAETAGTQPAAETPGMAPAPGADAQVITPITATGDPAIMPQMPTANPAAKQEPPQNAAGVWHYTCPKGCKGGAGAANPCAKCGATLAHNAAYHPQQTPPTTTTTAAPAAPAGLSADPTAVKKVEPPQNKAGVWHYTCPDGCAGGGGSAVACQKCSKMLVHNTAYHQ